MGGWGVGGGGQVWGRITRQFFFVTVLCSIVAESKKIGGKLVPLCSTPCLYLLLFSFSDQLTYMYSIAVVFSSHECLDLHDKTFLHRVIRALKGLLSHNAE